MIVIILYLGVAVIKSVDTVSFHVHAKLNSPSCVDKGGCPDVSDSSFSSMALGRSPAEEFRYCQLRIVAVLQGLVQWTVWWDFVYKLILCCYFEDVADMVFGEVF